MNAQETRTPMTVAQIRAVINDLPDDMVLKWSNWDSENGYTYVYGIERITDTGGIRPVLVDGRSDWEDEEAEELAAEQETAAAESRASLYHDDSR